MRAEVLPYLNPSGLNEQQYSGSEVRASPGCVWTHSEKRLIHLVLGMGWRSLRIGGLDLTLPESRRAVVLDNRFGARHSRGLYGVRQVGCGVTDRSAAPLKFLQVTRGSQRLRACQTVVKVCCSHQELSESARVFSRSFCSS